MTKSEFLKEIRKPGPVWAWVNIYENDGEYIQVNKQHVIETVTSASDATTYVASRRDNGLYLD